MHFKRLWGKGTLPPSITEQSYLIAYLSPTEYFQHGQGNCAAQRSAKGREEAEDHFLNGTSSQNPENADGRRWGYRYLQLFL